MKRKIFVFMYLFVGHLFCQIDSVKEAIKFYPMNLGDYWEYTVYDGPSPFTYYAIGQYSLEVVSDTMMKSGIIYKILRKKYFNTSYTGNIFERIDSSDGCVYRYRDSTEYKIDSLLSRPGDRIYASHFGKIEEDLPSDFRIICVSEATIMIFNQNRIVKKMNDNTRIPNEFYDLAKGLGRISNWGWEGNYWGESLKYARIAGIKYGTKVSIKEAELLPNQFRLFQNYPNPFNPATKINYSIPQTSRVKITIYNILGEIVADLVNEEKLAGNYTLTWNAKNVSSGIYICRIAAVNSKTSFVNSIKMVYLK